MQDVFFSGEKIAVLEWGFGTRKYFIFRRRNVFCWSI